MENEIKYKRNFLKPVIIRLDFHNFIQNEIVFSAYIEACILEYFPFKGGTQKIRFNSITVNENTNNASRESNNGLRKDFFSSSLTEKVILSNMYLIMQIDKYESFDIHKERFLRISNALFSINNFIIKKTTLRYINLYDEWRIKLQKRFFKEDIAASLQKNIDERNKPIKLIRSMHVQEYYAGNTSIIFRYGMYNPHYPAVLRTNSFVLDYESFTNEIFHEKGQIINFLDNTHECIQNLFEYSITESLRNLMNNE